jgi:hypothetical protein
MDEQQVVMLRALASNVQGSKDDILTAITYKTDQGFYSLVHDDEQISFLVARIINRMEQVAAKRAPKTEDETFTFDPIPAAGIGMSPGRTKNEAFVAMRLANLTLTFSIDLTALSVACERLLANTSRVPKQRPS